MESSGFSQLSSVSPSLVSIATSSFGEHGPASAARKPRERDSKLLAAQGACGGASGKEGTGPGHLCTVSWRNVMLIALLDGGAHS